MIFFQSLRLRLRAEELIIYSNALLRRIQAKREFYPDLAQIDVELFIEEFEFTSHESTKRYQQTLIKHFLKHDPIACHCPRNILRGLIYKFGWDQCIPIEAEMQIDKSLLLEFVIMMYQVKFLHQISIIKKENLDFVLIDRQSFIDRFDRTVVPHQRNPVYVISS